MAPIADFLRKELVSFTDEQIENIAEELYDRIVHDLKFGESGTPEDS